ncbi:MAG: DUF1837 domain-containing protein [Rhodospirillales bacterium]|nr:DUF1837 domain-containing protein [Rhodospirillales bacterium]
MTKVFAEHNAPEGAASQPEPADPFDLDAALRACLRRGGASPIAAHLICLKRDVVVGTTKTKLHCYFLPVDGNGRIRMKPLAEFLRDQIIDYAIPRKTIRDAIQQFTDTGSTAAMSNLHERARRLFTHLATTGEGGELLLFAMAEALFDLTQIICKMTLKTSTSMHYHGSDGVYAEARADGGLNLYWGESKIYGDAAAAIRSCMESLAPFLREPEGEDAARDQDLLLINEFANFTDERVIAALKKFLDKNDPSSLSVRHCGFALSAFDCDCYPGSDNEAKVDELAAAITKQLNTWANATDGRVCHEKLEKFDIHFICIPLPSAGEFRSYFLSLLRVQNDS